MTCSGKKSGGVRRHGIKTKFIPSNDRFKVPRRDVSVEHYTQSRRGDLRLTFQPETQWDHLTGVLLRHAGGGFFRPFRGKIVLSQQAAKREKRHRFPEGMNVKLKLFLLILDTLKLERESQVKN